MKQSDDLSSGWITTRLKRYLTVRSGDMISADDETQEGFPIIGGNGLRGYTYKTNTKGPALVIGRVGAKCGCVHLVDSDFWASEHALVVFPRRELDLHFGRYLLEKLDLNQYASRTAQPLINTGAVENQIASWPPIETQQRIAKYLDQETEQIDSLVLEKERMLSLLAEKRAALVSRAVTRGLDPDAPLKPSGYPWLADIPAHWKVKRSKQVLRERDERSATGDEELLTVSHINGVTKRSEKKVYMFEAETTEGYKRCSPGNLVINTLWAWMGAMGIAWEAGIVSPAYHVYELSSELLPGYVDALVRTPVFAKEVIRISTGVWSSRLRLYPEGLYEVRLPVPPLEEQQQIIDAISSERQQTAEMEAALNKSIELLKERRRALITAAVTGRIEIPEISS